MERKCKICGAKIRVDKDKRIVKINMEKWYMCSECNKWLQEVLETG